MKVLAYINNDAPESMRAISVILHEDGSLHPVMFRAKTEIEACEKAQKFWDDELARFRAIDGRTKEGRALKQKQQTNDEEI